jgi:hypothetical protein
MNLGTRSESRTGTSKPEFVVIINFYSTASVGHLDTIAAALRVCVLVQSLLGYPPLLGHIDTVISLVDPSDFVLIAG